MNKKDESALWDTGAELPNDPRLWKRVFCLSLLASAPLLSQILSHR